MKSKNQKPAPNPPVNNNKIRLFIEIDNTRENLKELFHAMMELSDDLQFQVDGLEKVDKKEFDA